MMKFDKQIKKNFKNIDIPESYDKRVDQILQSLEEKVIVPEKKKIRKKVFAIAVCCVFCIICFICLGRNDMQANILTYIKETIMDFLKGEAGGDTEGIGVESNRVYVENKSDLMMELQETVIDSHSIYLLVKITAPTNIKFTKDIGFDYFCFSKGENYNNNQLLSGSRNCELLEVDKEKPNAATYIVSQTFDETLEEGSNVTVSFMDLKKNPYSDKPKMLVEGLWSITVPYHLTVTDNISIEGNEDMVFPYINTTATVKSVELTPLGIVLISDISNFPSEELGVSDTTIAIRLKKIDGTEQVIVTHDTDEEGFVQGGESAFYEEDGKSYQQDTLEFSNMINISKVSGIYIEDLYVPVK